MLRNKYWLVAVAGLLVLVAVAASYVARESLDSSHVAVMGRFATDAVCQYASEHDGQWPTAWSDLEPYFSYESPGVSQVIAIDFHSDPQRLARQSPADFTAIRPARDCRPVPNELKEYWGVPRLQALLKQDPAE